MSCEQGTFKPESNSFWLTLGPSVSLWLSLGLTLSMLFIQAHFESVWLILALFLGSGSLRRSLAHKFLARLVTLLSKFIPPWLRHEGKIFYFQFHLRLFHIWKCTEISFFEIGELSPSHLVQKQQPRIWRGRAVKSSAARSWAVFWIIVSASFWLSGLCRFGVAEA